MLFEWHSLDHVGSTSPSAPVTPAGNVDYFHLNSIGVDTDGDLLVSARHTSTVYKLDRETGAVKWRLGGKKSDFQLGPGAASTSSTTPARCADGTLTLFDNGASPAGAPALSGPAARHRRAGAHGLTGKRIHALGHPLPKPGQRAAASRRQRVRRLGQEPYISEFDPTGRLLFDARLGSAYQSYRAYRLPWAGTPFERPALLVQRAGPYVQAFASWNGAMDVAAWRLLGEDRYGRRSTIASAPAAGFETSVSALSTAQRFSVEALDAGGRPLGRSPRVAAARI